MMIRARRPFVLDGRDLATGDIVDLNTVTLPPGRAQRLVDARLAEYVASPQHDCPACGRAFGSAHALAIHRSRAHSGPNEE